MPSRIYLFVLLMQFAAASSVSAANYFQVKPAAAAAPSSNTDETIETALAKAGPGDTVEISPGKYRENLTVTEPNVRIQGSDGAELQGTLRVEAFGALLINLTIRDEDHCVVLG